MLDEILRGVTRRYRLPPLAALARATTPGPATELAIALEQAREALVRGETPDESTKRRFIDALARMIRNALRAESGDPVFQAMVLRHRAVQVREYASLSAQADENRRAVSAAVAAIAHPGKQARIASDSLRCALSRLYVAASSARSSDLQETARRLLDLPDITSDPSLKSALARLCDSEALAKLLRLEALESDERVQRYRSLWDRRGPRPGSATAVARGVASQRRGEATEAAAAHALEALARRLDETEGVRDAWRIVTSMRVPGSIPASHARAKTEWDAVLLRRAHSGDEAPLWDVRLLVEAKASVDAATSDFPRLLRGLRLLGHADANAAYVFETRQGAVRLRGASLSALSALPASERALERAVLYCCDAPAEASPRLLGAASQMQLLSAPASLEFASALTELRGADESVLEPLWTELLASPRWRPVLDQYPLLRQVRELMVHTSDLLGASAAI